MLDLLKPGGWLVSVMSAGINFRDNRLIRELKEKLSAMAEWDIEELEDGAFRASGTMVRTILLTAQRNIAEVPAPAGNGHDAMQAEMVFDA